MELLKKGSLSKAFPTVFEREFNARQFLAASAFFEE